MLGYDYHGTQSYVNAHVYVRVWNVSYFICFIIGAIFTSVGTTRGQGIIRVFVVVPVTFFWHSHFIEEFLIKYTGPIMFF